MKKSSLAVSIIIPVYNEPDNISKTLRLIKKYVPVNHEVLTVYDSDRDTTLPVLNKLKKNYKNLHVIKNNIAQGASGALRTGFACARGNRILVTMADLCDDLTQIKELLNLVPQHADIACPSRYCKGGRQELKSSLKVWAPRTAGLLLKFLTGMPTVDPTNSFKLYSSKVFNDISLHSTISFSVTLEIMAKAHCLGYRIVEIPTVWHDRQHGKTSFELGRSLFAYFPWFCIAILRNRLFSVSLSLLRKWHIL